MNLRMGLFALAMLGIGVPVGLAADNKLTTDEKKAGWHLMFNGEDTSGWVAQGKGQWEVEDEVLVGRQGDGYLAYTGGKFDQYADFEFSADIKVSDTNADGKKRSGNSGVYFRTPGPFDKDKAAGGMEGYEAQVDHGDEKFPTGSIYAYPRGKDGGVKDGEWFNYRIKAEGWRFQIWVNGEQTLDVIENSEKFPKGYFRLQVHLPTTVVMYKNVKVRELGGSAVAKGAVPAVLDFKVKDIDGKDVALADYKGKVLMVVNVASKCGLTPQYTDLQKLYKEYNGKGFEILAFPANNFGAQEPGTESEIKEFCSSKYSVSFPMFSKVSVKGEDQCDLYKFLTDKDKNPHTEGVIRWNFEKFIVGRNGEVVANFHPKTKPYDSELVSTIEGELAKK
jgi:glutathione peroxidase